MKKYIVVAFLLLSFSCFSQTWQWAKSGGGAVSDDGSSVCQDSNGNVYMAGYYDNSPSSTTTGTFDTITIPYVGASQIFLVKYSSTGDVLWAKSIGGNDSPTIYGEQPYKVIYEPVSNTIYISGMYQNTTILGNDTLPGNGFFIAKLNINGNYIWAKHFNIQPATSTISSDNYGNIYISGYSTANTIFDTIPISGSFLAKFNSSGNCIKVNSNFTGCYIGRISFRNGSLYLAGAVNNDTILLDTLVKTFSGSNNSFISKFGTDLRMKWAKFMTTSSMYTSGIYDICTDSLCNSYIVGQFTTNMNFGSVNLTTSSTFGDLFIAKYDSNGVFQWANKGYNTVGTIDNVFVKSLTNGDFYIAGPYNGTDLMLGTYTISSVSAYIARYNSSGTCLNVVTIPGSSSGYCQGLSVDASNNFCVIGYFLSTLNIGGNSVTSHGFGDVYVAKHDAITHVGLKYLNTNNQLIIYANPNAGKCIITMPDEFKTETKLTLQILDNTGKLLQQIPVEMMQDKISVNITAEAKGMYTAILSNGVKSYTGKIIFE